MEALVRKIDICEVKQEVVKCRAVIMRFNNEGSGGHDIKVVWSLDIKAVGGENIWWLSPAVSHSESDGGGRLLWRVQKGKEFFVTFVTKVSGYSRKAEPQIWEKILKFWDFLSGLNSEISLKIVQFFPFSTKDWSYKIDCWDVNSQIFVKSIVR